MNDILSHIKFNITEETIRTLPPNVTIANHEYRITRLKTCFVAESNSATRDFRPVCFQTVDKLLSFCTSHEDYNIVNN